MRVVLGGLLRPAEGCAQPPDQFDGKCSRCLRGRMKMQRDGRRSQPIGTAIALAWIRWFECVYTNYYILRSFFFPPLSLSLTLSPCLLLIDFFWGSAGIYHFMISSWAWPKRGFKLGPVHYFREIHCVSGQSSPCCSSVFSSTRCCETPQEGKNCLQVTSQFKCDLVLTQLANCSQHQSLLEGLSAAGTLCKHHLLQCGKTWQNGVANSTPCVQ